MSTDRRFETLKRVLAHKNLAIEAVLAHLNAAYVLKVRDLDSRRTIIVKAFDGQKADPAMFRREIDVAIEFGVHPNIVNALFQGEDYGWLFYAMPLYPGSLEDRTKEGPVPLVDAVEILQGVLDALEFSHAKGLVHPDLRSTNIMLVGNSPIVTGYGVAVRSGEQETSAAGTTLSMAPEQSSGDMSIDRPADIYAFGVLAYSLLTNQLPFTGTVYFGFLGTELTNVPPKPTDLRGDIPIDVSRAIMTCLNADPVDQWSGVKTIREALLSVGNSPSQVVPTGTALWERITDDGGTRAIELLEELGLAVIAAGAMAPFFPERAPSQLITTDHRLAVRSDRILHAIHRTTAAIFNELDRFLSKFANDFSCALKIYVPSTMSWDWLSTRVSRAMADRFQPMDRFFDSQQNTLGLVCHGLDGAQGFELGLPYCSTAAILVDGHPQISAIYDVLGETLFKAAVWGPGKGPVSGSIATSSKGSLVSDLRGQADGISGITLADESVAIHVTKSHNDMVHELLAPSGPGEDGRFERIAVNCYGTWELRTGPLSMANLASGGFGGYVNIVSHPGDVAAPQVLVEAAGGMVTDFEGNPICFRTSANTSVLAAKRSLHHDLLSILNPVSDPSCVPEPSEPAQFMPEL